jgi:gas vesicle structural protein
MRDWYENKDITLLDILDGILDKGVVLKGEIIISVANIDLVYIDLRLLVTAVESAIAHSDFLKDRTA